MTASALYDGVEPIVIWRAFFRTVQEMENGFNGQVSDRQRIKLTLSKSV